MQMNNNPNALLHLRPHHLLCLQSFVGHGYSEEFVQEMASIKQQLTLAPHTAIELVHGADMLCRHCPNCINGRCTSDKPALFDRAVAAKIGSAEKSFPSQDSEINHDSISYNLFLLYGIPECLTLSHALVEECCIGCEWKELCQIVIDGNEKYDNQAGRQTLGQ